VEHDRDELRSLAELPQSRRRSIAGVVDAADALVRRAGLN
jgi:hypothetical protein